jgi:CRP-like cAMP-binding protein
MMHEALSLMSALEDRDLRWLLDAGHETTIDAGTEIITEHAEPDHLYVVLSGLVGIRVASLGDALLARLGPGELLGEISFLEGVPASATAVATESTTLLALPRAALSAKLESEPAFGARFYRALALLGGRRLRERVGTLGRWLTVPDEPPGDAARAPREALARAFDELKDLLLRAGEQAKRRGGDPASTLAPTACELLNTMVVSLNTTIGEEATDGPNWRTSMGRRVQKEFLPYLLLSRCGERWYTKPRGYAGDYLTIEWIYRNDPAGQGPVGKLLDTALLELGPCRAVRNRRGLLAAAIRDTMEGKGHEPTHVTSFACGPAEEIFDVLEGLDDPSRVHFTLIDIDWEALGHVSGRLEREGLGRYARLEHANLVYLATGRQTVSLADQDLVYSVGLTDYFEDRFVVALLDYAHRVLADGGKVVLGNVHPRNETRAFMDHVLDWKLIHRTDEDMNRIFSASRFGAPCTRIKYEAERINLFAEALKR